MSGDSAHRRSMGPLLESCFSRERMFKFFD